MFDIVEVLEHNIYKQMSRANIKCAQSADTGGPDHPLHTRSLIWVFPISLQTYGILQNETTYRKIPDNLYKPGFSFKIACAPSDPV